MVEKKKRNSSSGRENLCKNCHTRNSIDALRCNLAMLFWLEPILLKILMSQTAKKKLLIQRKKVTSCPQCRYPNLSKAQICVQWDTI